MHDIVEQNILLRDHIELPDGCDLTTEAFREGWNLARTVDTSCLEEKINTCGWHFIKIADGLMKNGVGTTSQEAIANALRLSLGRVSEHFNAVEVEHIELSQYPWFFLAKVQIYPFRIQQSAVLPLPDHYEPRPAKLRKPRLTLNTDVMGPSFCGVMPELKVILIRSKKMQGSPQ